MELKEETEAFLGAWLVSWRHRVFAQFVGFAIMRVLRREFMTRAKSG